MFRFTIRDVLWLMVVVGLACGWWVEHKRAAWQALIHARDADKLTQTVKIQNNRILAKDAENSALSALLDGARQDVNRLRNRQQP
jgi:hypothetical protein